MATPKTYPFVTSKALGKVRILPLTALVCLPLLGACGASVLLEKKMTESWQWDGGVEASRVFQAVEKAKAVPTLDAAVGVTGRGLVGRTLPDGKLWSYEGLVDVLPTILADLVLFTGEGRLTAIELTSGKVRFSIGTGGRRLEGAGYDGRNSVLLLVDKDDARKDQLRVVGPFGDDLYSASADARIGTPAATQGFGLVPYSGQYIAGFDLSSGKLLGRILYRDSVHTVRITDQGIFVYGAGVTLLTPKLASSPDSRSLKLKLPMLPGSPEWPVDGSKPRPTNVRPVEIYATPVVSEGRLRFFADTYVASYYQILTGFDATTHVTRWVSFVPRAVVGGEAGKWGPTVCLEDGSVLRFRYEDGAAQPYGSLESRIKTCVVSALEGPMKTGARPPLHDQIVDTLANTGPDMVAMQTLLLNDMAKKGGREVTQTLLRIAQDPLVSSELARRAGGLLEEQTDGGEEMVAALEAYTAERNARVGAARAGLMRQAPKDLPPSDAKSEKTDTKASAEDSWTDETAGAPESAPASPRAAAVAPQQRKALRPPPVASLAKALLRLKTKGAAQALAPYLSEPSLTSEQIGDVMATVSALGGKDQVEVVMTFLTSYKNTGGDEALITALVQAARFLFQHLDDEGRSDLRQALDQTLTHPDLRARTAGLGTAEEKP